MDNRDGQVLRPSLALEYNEIQRPSSTFELTTRRMVLLSIGSVLGSVSLEILHLNFNITKVTLLFRMIWNCRRNSFAVDLSLILPQRFCDDAY